MIVFDLRCAPQGHVFEAWFGSSVDYQSQQKRGLVQCPLCGSLDIDKAAMAPRIGTGTEALGTTSPAEAVTDPASVKELLSAMAALQRRMLENSHYVGDRFANEARAIYLGEADARAIYGKATEAEKRSLLEDGIEVAPLPFPIVLPGEEN
jgi:hypothetical protein